MPRFHLGLTPGNIWCYTPQRASLWRNGKGMHHLFPRPRRALWTLLVACLAVKGPAAAAEGPLARLAARLEVDRQRADHVLVVDMSGSMQWEARPGSRRKASPGARRMDVLLEALPALLEGIAPGDHVVVVGFHETLVEDPALVVDRWDGEESLRHLLSALRSRIRFGPATDLGLALEAAMKHVARPDGNPIQFVYFLTDGEHDAPHGSPYRDPDSPAWSRSASIWEGLFRSEDRLLGVYLFGLFDVRDSGPLARVLPRLNFLTFRSGADFRSYLATLTGDALRHRVAMASRREAAKADWTASISEEPVPLAGDGTAEVELALEVTIPHLDFSGRLEVAEASAVFPEGGEIRIPATAWDFTDGFGKTRTLTVAVRGPARTTDWWSFGRCHETTLNLDLSWSALGWEPRGDFESTGLADVRPFHLTGRKASATIRHCTRGLLWVPILIAALLLSSGVLLFLRYRPRTLNVSVSGGPRYRGTARKVTVGSAPSCTLVVPGFPPRAFQILRERAGLGSRFRLKVEASGCKVNGRPVSQGLELDASPSQTLEAGDKVVRLSIEM